ncbi:MAG: ABC transporter permease [Candidatus Methanofastidiosum sp.]|nr:ABC transporter permease [Methanofastidiosum sp.]NYT14209.1 ABC transporter permease [Candidatus Methanofastidiosa archaeon]
MFSEIRRNPLLILFFIFGMLIVVYIIAALSNMLYSQLVLHPGDFIAIIKDPDVLKSIWLTLYTSFLGTLIGVILGIPLAYILARYEFHGKDIIEAIVDIPIIIPHTVAGIALFSLLMKRGVVGMAFSKIGIVFQDNMWGIVMAMFFVSCPFFVGTVREGFKSVNPNLESVARTLGASQWKSFYQIALPLTSRHIFSGAIMSWARGISEFGAIIIIAYYPMIASTLILARFNTNGLLGSQPIAVLLIIICFITFVALRLVSKRGRRV